MEFLACDRELPGLRLPAIAAAESVLVEFLPDLTQLGGRLHSGGTAGVPVHAGSFLRERRIVLESALLSRVSELRRIMIHELFHFVWMRLGNVARHQWEALLSAELAAKGRGELGWSAEFRKDELKPKDRRLRTIRWREYACESFCDSAAWLYAGIANHEEYTLARRWREPRARFFQGLEKRPLAL